MGRTEAAVRTTSCNVRCFTATYENKKFQHAAFLLSTLAPHLTELSKVLEAGYFNFAQMRASVELCINKLSDAAAKSQTEANCEKFDSEFGELKRRRVVCRVAWRFGRAPKDWQIDISIHKKGGRSE